MLHSHKISFEFHGKSYQFESPLSRLFTDSNLCKDRQLAAWTVSFERRETLYPELLQEDQALRLMHKETGDLRIDKAGAPWVMGWWRSEPPSETEIGKLSRFMEMMDQQQWCFHWRPGAGQSGQAEIFKQSQTVMSDEWVFCEGPLKYRASLKRGHNFGLFLDQRERRQWLQDRAQGKAVLNLFAFTCGFSLNAAYGGASQVVSVDSFSKYLQWGKENFRLNDLDPDQYEFRTMDALDYLKYAAKKGLKFDFIVCDPPSFSRSKKQKKVFRVERDHPELLSACAVLLNPGGTLLFSTNYEKWDYEKWHEALLSYGPVLGFGPPSPSFSQWDYEWQSQQANLKAFFLKKT